MSSLVCCARCGATLDERERRRCPTCEPAPRLSEMERFARVYAAHVHAGYARDDAARAAAPIASSKVEA